MPPPGPGSLASRPARHGWPARRARRRVGHRARGPGRRPVRSALVGAAAPLRPGGHRGRAPRLPVRRRARAHHRELPGERRGLRAARGEPRGGGRTRGQRRSAGTACSGARRCRRRAGPPPRSDPTGRCWPAARSTAATTARPASARSRPSTSGGLRVLLAAGPDCVACETIPRAGEAAWPRRALLDRLGAPDAWISFFCRDGRSTSHGEPIEEAVAAATVSRRVVAVGVNCTPPEHVEELLTRAAYRHRPAAGGLSEQRSGLGRRGTVLDSRGRGGAVARGRARVGRGRCPPRRRWPWARTGRGSASWPWRSGRA